MNTDGSVDTQDVTQDYKAFLAHTAKRIKELRRERGLTLRDMVVVVQSVQLRMATEEQSRQHIEKNGKTTASVVGARCVA
jgi:hypothetical protein